MEIVHTEGLLSKQNSDFFIKRRNYGLIEIIFDFFNFDEKPNLLKINKNCSSAILKTRYLKVIYYTLI